MKKEQKNRYSIFLTIMAWGTFWGIFEASIGYLLHMLPFNVGWLIWYPAACFFMTNVYRRTGRVSSVLYVGILCASIKMLNLLLPGRIDKVINPAISIIFQALAMFSVILILNKFFENKRKNPIVSIVTVLGMNTCWRLLFILYLLFLVPNWIRDISVISSIKKFIPFSVSQNLATSLILYLGYQFNYKIFKPIETVEQKLTSIRTTLPVNIIPAFKTGIVFLMLCANVVLELSL